MGCCVAIKTINLFSISKRFLLIDWSSAKIFSAALISRFLSDSTASRSACSTILPSTSTSSFTSWISVSNVLRSISPQLLSVAVLYRQNLTIPPGNVPFGALVFRVGEDGVGLVKFDHRTGTFAIFIEHHHGRVIGGAGGLLH